MSYNPEAQIFQNQVVINDTTNAGITSGGLVVKGGLSTQDTFVTGHVAVNNVKITPNLNDIVNEIQYVLSNSITEFTDVTDFYFDNSVTNSFKAQVSTTVSTGISKYAVWEFIGVYKPSGWTMTTSFTGDITGINFRIADDEVNGRGKIQYTNSNSSGTTTIKFRATTTQPPGSSPTGSTGIINNTSGPYIADTLIFANTTSSIASSDLTYASNVLKIGGTSRIVGENANAFTNFSNGGAITSMGDMSVAKNLIIGEKIGIAKTSPAFSLDVSGDINFTGSFYQNGSLYSGSSIWQTSGNDVFYTTGNVGLGTTAPTSRLDVAGGIVSTSMTTGTLSATSANFSTGITAANINFTGNLYKNGSVYVSSQWTTDPDLNLYYTTGYIAIGNTAPSQALDVTGSIRASGGVNSSTMVASSGITAGNALFTNASATSITSASALFTNVSATSVTSASFVGTNANFTNVTFGSFVSGAGTVGGNLVPSTNITYDLGSSTLRWKDLYLSGNTIHLGEKQLSLSGDTFTLEKVNATSTENATSVSTGALVVAGGAGIAKDLHIGQNLVVAGNLTVSGSTVTYNSETMTIQDNIILLNSGPSGLYDAGIMMQITQGNFACMYYDTTTEDFNLIHTSTSAGSTITPEHWVGLRVDHLHVLDTTNASGVGTGGALNVAGGASIVKDMFVGGNFAASGTVTSSSDVRLKENIEQITGALDKIEQCRGVSYTKKASGQKEIGFIAQELEELFPELVITNGDGYKSVAYGNVTAVLVECIKELKKELDDLKSKQ